MNKNAMLDPGSLTQKLKAAGAFEVKVVAEHFIVAEPSVAEALGLSPGARVWCRDVVLCVDGEPWVLAQTYVPETSLVGEGEKLKHLGAKPLGELLFSDPNLRRSEFKTSSEADAFIRSSIFYFHGFPLLLREKFLPRACAYFGGELGV